MLSTIGFWAFCKKMYHSELVSESIHFMEKLASQYSGSESGMMPSLNISSTHSKSGAMHVAKPPILAKAGFTLAEVLITLGIIGVVCAMTIPTLMTKFRNYVYVTSLKKNYAAMTQGFKMMLAEDYADDFGGSQYFLNMGKSSCSVPADIDNDSCASFWAGLERHLKLSPATVDKNRKTKYLNNSAYSLSYVARTKYLAMPSGMYILSATFRKKAIRGNTKKIAELGGHMYTLQGQFTIDINGPANPNKVGRDIFSFYVDNTGQMFAAHSKDQAIYDGQLVGLLYWPNYNRCGRGVTSGVKDSLGEGCAARIMERGWIMDY